MSVEEYLRGEPLSEVRHEYVDGEVFAMEGRSRAHNAISLNFASELRHHLRGKPCGVFMADVKARVLAHQQDTFYYPDVMVGCDERDTHELYLKFSPSSSSRCCRRAPNAWIGMRNFSAT